MVTEINTIKGFDFNGEEVREVIRNNKLIQISVNVSAKCNCRCDYCLMNSGEQEENELTNDEIKRVLREARDLGAKTWYIAGDGEPLLHGGIEDLIDYSNNLNMWVVMATNGELLTRKKARELKQKNLSIITKFNSFDKKTFDELVRTDATFVEFKGLSIPRGVDSLINTGFNDHNPSRAGIETVIISKNIDEIPDIYKFAQQYNLFTNIEIVLPIGRAKNHPELFLTEEQIRNLYMELDKIRGRDINSLIRNDLSHYEGIGCFDRLRYSVYTNSQGRVYLCFSQCPELDTGMNVKEYSLKEIIEKRKFPQFYSGCACLYFSDKRKTKS